MINTSSSHLVDDSALKRALISGAVGGAALDGVEGPEWLEAWVRYSRPRYFILPLPDSIASFGPRRTTLKQAKKLCDGSRRLFREPIWVV